MPIWKGKRFDFDPDLIAGLLYRGEEVLPDTDISPEHFEAEVLKNVGSEKLWG